MDKIRNVEFLDEFLVELAGFGMRISDVFVNN